VRVLRCCEVEIKRWLYFFRNPVSLHIVSYVLTQSVCCLGFFVISGVVVACKRSAAKAIDAGGKSS
jgi:hypothetical protein